MRSALISNQNIFEPSYSDRWYSDKRVAFIRSKVKPQSSWLLHLAGDHHQNFETKPLLHGQHMMRCMLTANLAVDQRFANGCPLFDFYVVICMCVAWTSQLLCDASNYIRSP